MPERKGRKRRARERRRAHGREPGAAPPPAGGPPEPRERGYPSRPALRWRYAGFLLGVVTMFFGVLTVAQGVSSSGANAVVMMLAGAFLVALALALAVLAVFPDRVRAWLQR